MKERVPADVNKNIWYTTMFYCQSLQEWEDEPPDDPKMINRLNIMIHAAIKTAADLWPWLILGTGWGFTGGELVKAGMPISARDYGLLRKVFFGRICKKVFNEKIYL